MMRRLLFFLLGWIKTLFIGIYAILALIFFLGIIVLIVTSAMGKSGMLLHLISKLFHR